MAVLDSSQVVPGAEFDVIVNLMQNVQLPPVNDHLTPPFCQRCAVHAAVALFYYCFAVVVLPHKSFRSPTLHSPLPLLPRINLRPHSSSRVHISSTLQRPLLAVDNTRYRELYSSSVLHTPLHHSVQKRSFQTPFIERLSL